MNSVADDPRMTGILRGATPAERFIVAGLYVVLNQSNLLPAVLEAMGSSSRHDLQVHVAGRPLAYWWGKTKAAIEAEAADAAKVAAVLDALQVRGIPVPGWTPEPKAQAPAAQEPTFAGRRLSELADMSDEQLLAIEGISRATIREIRRASKAK
jgi:hypothetical protein